MKADRDYLGGAGRRGQRVPRAGYSKDAIHTVDVTHSNIQDPTVQQESQPCVKSARDRQLAEKAEIAFCIRERMLPPHS